MESTGHDFRRGAGVDSAHGNHKTRSIWRSKAASPRNAVPMPMELELDVPLASVARFEAESPRLVSGDFDLAWAEEGRTVSVDFRRLRERASFAIGEDRYSCRRTGLIGWDYRLGTEEGEIAAARRDLLFRGFRLRHGAEQYELRSRSRGWTPYFLLRDGRRIGRIDRLTARARRVQGELPVALPEPVRIFVVYLAIVAWRRVAGAVIGTLLPDGSWG
jgi:hypothetical protein